MKKTSPLLKKIKPSYSKEFASRLKIINYLYKYELMLEKLTSDEAFESGDFTSREIKIIDKISENYEKLGKTIKKYLHESWTWERLMPLEKAILIFGAFELQIADLALVINELIIITKGLIPDNKYQYINSILDQVGNEYAKIKKN